MPEDIDRLVAVGGSPSSTDSYTDAVERDVTRITAAVGQPDFTYRAQAIPKGPGIRELGDTLIVVGDSVVVVSTKARDPSAAARDDPDSARRWMTKAVTKAQSQVRGVIRTLTTTSGLVLRSERGIDVPFSPDLIDSYHGVIALHHPSLAGEVPQADGSPGFVITVADWSFVGSHIGSMTRLVEYVATRSRLGLAQPLGSEKNVLGALLHAEESGTDAVPLAITESGRAVPSGAWTRFLTDYPTSILGTDPDDQWSRLIDVILDGAHQQAPEFSDTEDRHDYLPIVEFLDWIPRRIRGHLGRMVLDKASAARQRDRPTAFRAQVGQRGWFLFLAHPGDRENRRQLLVALSHALAFRQADLNPEQARDRLVLGVATEPYPNEGRSHDYAYLSGLLPAPSSEKAEDAAEVFRSYFADDLA